VNRGVGRDESKCISGTHDLVDAQKQAATDHPGRMKPGKVFLLKSARFEQDHGERIAEGEHHGGAGGRSEIQRTGFLLDVYIEENVTILRES
jgi:hypothetical protein